MIDQILKDQKSRMKKAVENTAREMAVIRTGKASPALLDNIRVECWGGLHPIKQVAGISAPEPRLTTYCVGSCACGWDGPACHGLFY